MLTIICGEDIVASRNYLSQIKNDCSKKGEEVTNLSSQEVPNILKWQGDNLNLFASKLIFVTEHLESSIVRKRGKKSVIKSTVKTLEEIVLEIASRKDIELIDWEEKAGREIKLKDSAKVKEFKLYNVASAEDYDTHVLDMSVVGKGFKIYTFTFG